MAKILVADDDSALVELLIHLLAGDGHEVVGVADGKDCLARVGKEQPDLIILDVMMPGMDGFSVFNQIAERSSTAKIPVIVITAKEHARHAFEAVGRPADFIRKPFEIEEFRRRVAAVLAVASNR
jgi:DNA-binding response OmpR family regulator